MGAFGLRSSSFLAIWLPFLLLFRRVELCSSLCHEGVALLRFRDMVEIDPYSCLSNWHASGEEEDEDPCSWSGIACEDGRVVSLNLENCHLQGNLAPELGKLSHLTHLILHNNSFHGKIPSEIGELQKLKVLDLGYNNLSGAFPLDIDNIFALKVLCNKFLRCLSPKHHQMKTICNSRADGCLQSLARRILQAKKPPQDSTHMPLPPPISHEPMKNYTRPPPPAPSPSPPPSLSPPGLTPNLGALPSPTTKSPPPISVPTPSYSSHRNNTWIFSSIGIGSGLFIIAAIIFLYFRVKKVEAVKPWATGLSGQLQKAFVTGVPALKRSELETACEDFSNIIGSVKEWTFYKGTLSSGVEIAVTSAVFKSTNDWSKQSETQFRKKISTLSKVNHKNFVNLIGYCVEEQPFTRMMVFEYAPNGTLFDHLHIAEVEDLDWAARLRIAMGVGYCLEHMHQMSPPVILKNIDSTSIYLTDDYAAKVSDFELWSETIAADAGADSSGPLINEKLDLETSVYKYGMILLEIISGRLPFSSETGELLEWASHYLTGRKPLKDMIDPALTSYSEENVNAIFGVITKCLNSNPGERPSMKDVVGRLKEITAVNPEGATPKLSPLWWAELEIISSDAS